MKTIKTSQSVKLSQILMDISPSFKERYATQILNDGIVGLFESKEGHPVEVIIRPLRYGQYSQNLIKQLRDQGKTNEYHKLKSYEAKHTPQNELDKEASISNSESIARDFNMRDITPNKLPLKLDLLYKMGLHPIKGSGVYKFRTNDGIIFWESGAWKAK